MRAFRTIVVVAALAGGTVLALLRSVQGGIGSAREKREDANSFLKGSVKRWLRSIAVLLLVGGLGGILIVLAGLVPIKASSRHWTITAWFLNFTMERSVATHSLTIKQPDLDDPGLMAQGATHYEFGCRPCHGAPACPHGHHSWATTKSGLWWRSFVSFRSSRPRITSSSPRARQGTRPGSTTCQRYPIRSGYISKAVPGVMASMDAAEGWEPFR